MRFYEIDNALQEAIGTADKPVRVKIEIDFDGHFEAVFEQDIIEANFFGLKEAAGGTTARGELTISNEQGAMSAENPHPCGFSASTNVSHSSTKAEDTAASMPPKAVGVGSEVRVSFSIGEGLPYFQRFRFFIDDKGIQESRGPGRRRFVMIGLVDL
jgi:hypothetical protein